jgi:hypothetical protein
MTVSGGGLPCRAPSHTRGFDSWLDRILIMDGGLRGFHLCGSKASKASKALKASHCQSKFDPCENSRMLTFSDSSHCESELCSIGEVVEFVIRVLEHPELLVDPSTLNATSCLFYFILLRLPFRSSKAGCSKGGMCVEGPEAGTRCGKINGTVQTRKALQGGGA